MIQRYLVVCGFVLSALLAPLYAEPRPAQTQPAAKEAPTTHPAGDKISVTEHEINLGQRMLKYRASAGFLPLKDESGKPRANFFFVSYETIDDQPREKRPLMFVFNGGPGAAAIWLHLGTAGPKTIALDSEGYPGRPPYRLVDNPSTWLTAADLVFIDPVGTGFSRPAEGVKGEEFYGVQQDIDSVSEFIRLYLTRSKRWGSPKFLAGESYGTTRGAILSEHLLERYGIAINGVALISTVLNFQMLGPSASNELPYALWLPSFTAIAHYHKKLPPELQGDLGKTLSQVKTWAVETYTPALMQGAKLEAEKRRAIVTSLARFTGLDEKLIDRQELRIDASTFEKALLTDRRQLVGRFDGRIVGDALDPAARGAEYDPSLSRYVGVYSQTFNQYVREELKFETDLTYEYLSGRVHPWNWGRAGNGGYLYVGDNLRSAMTKNPHLKVMVASGYYDLATPFFATDYTVGHLQLAPDLRKNIRQTYYEGGHMMYHHAASMEKLNGDMKRFVEWGVGEKEK